MIEFFTPFMVRIHEVLIVAVPSTVAFAVVFAALTPFPSLACNPGRPWWRNPGLVTDLCYCFVLPFFIPYMRLVLLILLLLILLLLIMLLLILLLLILLLLALLLLIPLLLLLFLLLTLRMVTARFHPSNWLVRINETGIYVQYRSYLNYQFPADECCVVFFSFGEVASARLIKERVESPDPAHPGTKQTQYLRYVEVELSSDTAALAAALQAERSEQAPLEKHWYGTSSTVYRDYPVTMITPTSLRLRWDVVPGTQKFLDALRPYTVIADPVSVREDFTQLKSLGREEQQKELRKLAARGQTVNAIYVARQLYGCSLGEAKQMVDSLSQNKTAKSATPSE